MESLFKSHTTTNVPIILVDASGSVTCDFNTASVFDKIKNIIIGLKEERVRLIFWNSNTPEKPFFKDGVYRLPFIVNRDTLNQTFRHVQQQITNNCLTYPHLAFENIPDDWINDKDMTRIYFVTDGQMGYSNIQGYEMSILKDRLGRSINKIFEKHNNIQLNIITVEPKIADLTAAETTQNAAGCDVYDVIMNGRLTKYITKFISYTLNNDNGFIHINKNIPPAGHLPYADKYFSILKVGDFIRFIMKEIADTNDEDKHLQIIQNLSATLAVLTKDKQKSIIDGTINTFCDLFKNTRIDPMFVRFILTESIQKENEGTASIYSAYRSQLKDLYKRADGLLVENVRNAIGVGNKFITLPMFGKIVTGSFRLIDKNITQQHKVYRNGAVTIGKLCIPILPFYHSNSIMNEQCIRQWVRTVISRMHNVGQMDDEVIYIVLGYVLQVVLSDVNDEIKDSYRRLGTIMLKKKRLSTDMTELSRLESGELPIDNKGVVESFYRFMGVISNKLNIKLSPLALWYAICLAMNNEQMIIRQLIHCADTINKDFQDINPKELLNIIKNGDFVNKVTIFDVRSETTLDYNCLITMDDTSKIGGYKFLPHQTASNSICCPQNVLSDTGYTQLIAHVETCVCPICYIRLSATNFEKVGPKPDDIDMSHVFSEDAQNIFAESYVDPYSHAAPQQTNPITVTKPQTNNIVVVLMNGTVGAGKSHFSKLLKEHIEKNDGLCIVEGTDKYCRDGMQTRDAIRKVTTNIVDFSNVATEKKKYIIIDTCGENNKGTRIFDVDMSRWKIVRVFPNYMKDHLDEYLCWSLRNVMQRQLPDVTNTHYLNPVSAGVNVCVQVHMKKAMALFSGRAKGLVQQIPSTVGEIIKILDGRANTYAQLLETNMPISQEIEKLYASL